MPAKSDDKKQLRCSFCGKPQDQVKKLIAGKNVYICDECVKLCSDIIYEEYEFDNISSEASSLPKPAEIKKTLDDYVIGQEEAKKVLAELVKPDTALLFKASRGMALEELCNFCRELAEK